MEPGTVQFQGPTSTAKISVVCYQNILFSFTDQDLHSPTAHLLTSFLQSIIMADEVYEGAIGIDLGRHRNPLYGWGASNHLQEPHTHVSPTMRVQTSRSVSLASILSHDQFMSLARYTD